MVRLQILRLKSVIGLGAGLCLFHLPAAALTNGLSSKPLMGWNILYSDFFWGEYAGALTNIANAIHTNGMQAAGYSYICLDDCWYSGRNSNGVPIPSLLKFPDGMTNVIEHLHGLGLKFGLYSMAGKTPGGACGQTGAEDFETNEVNAFADWGVDLVKFDLSFTPEELEPSVVAYVAALARCGRPMILTSGLGQGMESWYPALMNSARVAMDVNGSWANVLAAIDVDAGLSTYAGPGYWNDLDFLMLGSPVASGMSAVEQQSQFALWCMLASPLIHSINPLTISRTNLDIITNPELIVIHQDGVQASRIAQSGAVDLWTKGSGPLKVCVLNRNSYTTNLILDLNALGFSGEVLVRDVWSRVNLGVFSQNVPLSVDPHGTRILSATTLQRPGISIAGGPPWVLTLTGSPGVAYSVVETQDLMRWTWLTNCTTDARGQCEFKVELRGTRFFRATWP